MWSAEKIQEELGLAGIDADQYSPLGLAYLGDCVYELIIRQKVMSEGNRAVNRLNAAGTRWAKAQTQARIAELLLEELTDEELRIYKRGRNSKSATPAKHASMADYRKATGFEALMGYLYLNGKEERILELIGNGSRRLEEENEEKP